MSDRYVRPIYVLPSLTLVHWNEVALNLNVFASVLQSYQKLSGFNVQVDSLWYSVAMTVPSLMTNDIRFSKESLMKSDAESLRFKSFLRPTHDPQKFVHFMERVWIYWSFYRKGVVSLPGLANDEIKKKKMGLKKINISH